MLTPPLAEEAPRYIGYSGLAYATDHIKMACISQETGGGCVSRVITDLGVFDVVGDGFRVVELADGVTIDEVRDKTGAPVLT